MASVFVTQCHRRRERRFTDHSGRLILIATILALFRRTNRSWMSAGRPSLHQLPSFSIAEGFVKTLLHNGGENHASMNRRAIEAITSSAWNAIRISQGRLCHLPLSKISCTAHSLACSLLASLTMANKDSPGTSPKNSSSCLLASRTTLGLLSRSKRTRSPTAPSLTIRAMPRIATRRNLGWGLVNRLRKKGMSFSSPHSANPLTEGNEMALSAITLR